MMTAYGHVWLGQDLPAFTKADAAVAPFEIESLVHPPLINETWTATTKMYSTTISCEPALTIRSDKGTMDQGYDNGKGCVVEPGSIPFEVSSPFTGLYISYYMDTQSDYALSSLPSCAAPNNSHTFLALWAANLGSQNPNITAIFCEPSYWIQDVNATVTVPNMTVSDLVPLASPVPLTHDVFNVSNYEYVIGTGAGATTSSRRSDISHTLSVIDQVPRLQRMGLSASVTNMVGFAIGGSRLDLPQYLDAGKLTESFEKAHKLLFALAVKDFFSPATRIADPRPGVVQGDTNAVVVFQILAVVTESLLGLITVFAVALMLNTWNRRSQLRKDPASLTDIVGMLTPSIKLGKITTFEIQSSGASPAQISPKVHLLDSAVHEIADKKIRTDKLLAYLKNGKIYLTANESDPKQPRYVRKIFMTAQEICDEERDPIAKDSKLYWPTEMTSTVAGIFISILLMAITTLALLQLQINKHLGLPLPSGNPVVTNIVLNYIPVVFATLLEPFWVMLNRLLCVLKPFEELRNGEAAASASLDLKYTSLPPQLVFLRAFRARHFLLAAVCAISVSANILAVSLSGLFQTNVLSMESNSTFAIRYLPIFNQTDGSTGSDHLYIAKTNFSDGTALPPWVSRDRFFLPFSLDTNSQKVDAQAYRATTQGFGMELNCAQADLNSVAYVTNDVDRFIVSQPAIGGRNVECKGIYTAVGVQNNSNAALEVLTTVTSANSNASQEDRDVCETIMVAGFLRANLTNYLSSEIVHINTVSSLWLTCRPTFLTAPYEITVATDGRIQTYTRKAPYSSDLGPYFTENFNITRLIKGTGWLLDNPPETQPFWHKDTFVDSWFGFFVKTLSNSSLPVDPSTPVPEYDSIAPLVEDIYTRLFAILLGLHPDWFAPAPAETELHGAVLVPCSRVFMSRPMFIIAISLISLNFVVAVAYYAKRPKRMLTEMPNTIASIIGLFEGSGLIAEKKSERGWHKDWKFGYGKYVGTDKKPHLGIERRPFVVPWADG